MRVKVSKPRSESESEILRKLGEYRVSLVSAPSLDIRFLAGFFMTVDQLADMLNSLLETAILPVECGSSSLVEQVSQTLAHPAVGNVALLIASVIGVVGSFLLYLKRRYDSRKKLKRALATELRGMEQIPEIANNLQSLSNAPPESRLSASSVPPAETFPTTVYEENASDLGLLSEEDLNEVVEFYSELLQHKGTIEGVRNDPEEVPMPDHQKIVDEFPDLVDKRDSLHRQLGFGSIDDEDS
jgi:hypothetical protein